MALASEAIVSRSAPVTDGSAVSWAAVIAGAVGAAAFSLILILLGTGIGLSVVSPWTGDGASAEAIGVSTIVWITVVQMLASVLGGYLAGRLRTRWVTAHSNEVYFRDTAHGFLAWAVATLLMATLLSSAIASSLSLGVKAGGTALAAAAAPVAAAVPAAAAAATGKRGSDAQGPGYYVDLLFRAPASGSRAAPAAPAATAAEGAAQSAEVDTGEVARVFAHAISSGELTRDDAQHLGQLVAAKTGLSSAEAEQRVTDTFNRFKSSIDEAAAKAKAAADEARKASAGTALWLVVSLLIGAFLASLAATFGGRLRDSSVLAHS
jgi:hypothetical protein